MSPVLVERIDALSLIEDEDVAVTCALEAKSLLRPLTCISGTDGSRCAMFCCLSLSILSSISFCCWIISSVIPRSRNVSGSRVLLDGSLEWLKLDIDARRL